MESPGQRLKLARQHAGFESGKDAAEKHGWPYPTYKAHESGLRGIKLDAADQYAAAFNVSKGWLLTGESPPNWAGQEPVRGRPLTRLLPIYQWSEVPRLADQEELEVAGARYHPIVDDPAVGRLAFALEILPGDLSMVGSSSDQVNFWPGDLIVFDPDRAPKPGGFVMACLREAGRKEVGEVMFRKYRPRGAEEAGHPVVEFSPSNHDYPPIKSGKSKRIAFAYPLIMKIQKF